MEQPNIVQPQFVVMPVPERNGLGAFAFFVALIGLFVPTGIVAMLGLVLGLAAIGRSPRGFATAAVILGLLGTVFWLGVMAVALAVGVIAAIGAAVFMAGAFVITQPEVVEITSDMVNVAIAVEEYQQEHGVVPDGIDGLVLGAATRIDPWGTRYRLQVVDDDPGFDIVSGGPDGAFETDDDVRMSRLDRVWEDALEGLEGRLEQFGERMDRIQHHHRSIRVHRHTSANRDDRENPRDHSAVDYERAAREAVADETSESSSESASDEEAGAAAHVRPPLSAPRVPPPPPPPPAPASPEEPDSRL